MSKLTPALFMSATDVESTQPIEACGRRWPRLRLSDYLEVESALRTTRRKHLGAIAKDSALTGPELAVFLLKNDPFDVAMGEVDEWLSSKDGARAVLLRSLSRATLTAEESAAAIDEVPLGAIPSLARMVIGFISLPGETDPKKSATGALALPSSEPTTAEPTPTT